MQQFVELSLWDILGGEKVLEAMLKVGRYHLMLTSPGTMTLGPTQT